METRKGKEAVDKNKRELKELCEKKREKLNRKKMEEINRIRTKTDAWKFINRERKVRKKVCEDITMENWRLLFMGVLEGVEKKSLGEERKGGDEEEDLTDEEIERQIRRLKCKKAAGQDGIRNEAWKSCKGQIRKGLKDVIKDVWRSEGWPES